MKLTTEQIECLFTFCKKHYVSYYDVQVELVDHLTESIQALLVKEPNLNFEMALEKVHKSFGIMGFSPLIAAKEKQMDKQQKKEKLALYLNYFKIPKILLTLCLLSIVFFVSRKFSGDVLFYLSYINMFCIVIYEFYIFSQIRKLFKQQKKTLLLLNNNPSLTFGCLTIFNTIQFIRFDNITSNQFLFINCCAILIFINILSYKVYAINLYTKAKKDYPLAFV